MNPMLSMDASFPAMCPGLVPILAPATTDPAALVGELASIAYFIVLPLLLMMGLGFALQRRMGLDMPTLTRLNFHLVVPAMVYFAIVTSEVMIDQVLLVVGFSVALMMVLGAFSLLVAKLRGVERDQWRAMLMSTIFYNAGNYGLPLQNLAFRNVSPEDVQLPAQPGETSMSNQAEGLQVYVMLVQNVTSFTIGVFLAAGRASDGLWRRNLLQIARFPPIYALFAALLTVLIRRWLGEHAQDVAAALSPFWETVDYVRRGFVIIALATLGAQLAIVARDHAVRYPVTSTVILRLLIGPAIGLALVHLLGISGFAAQVLLISTATPTSVNCLLLCMEFRNHPDFVARSVFYSTVISPITVTLVILLSRSGALPG
ncbi:MAG: AEC family transporter [Phycisphaeraceae bacterium]|nr:AEC family transporter [Phycisphaeraceae bacterium]